MRRRYRWLMLPDIQPSLDHPSRHSVAARVSPARTTLEFRAHEALNELWAGVVEPLRHDRTQRLAHDHFECLRLFDPPRLLTLESSELPYSRHRAFRDLRSGSIIGGGILAVSGRPFRG